MDVVVDGLGFLEAPRWRDGKLWFSDFVASKVRTLDGSGRLEDVAVVDGIPSGLGWLPDGTLVIVSMEGRRLVRADGTVHADLSDFASNECNDMVVDSRGNAYVGQFGFDYRGGTPPRATTLMLVRPDGSVTVVADEMLFPNGSVITPDGKTLIVGESFGGRMTAFGVNEDGTLYDRRVWAQLSGATPDGCCLDDEGAIWIASPISKEVLRVREGGEVVERLSTGEHNSIACMLGGEDRRTLYICSGELTFEEGAGAILATRVDVPGAGLP